MKARILLLPGDGIGPEVTEEAVRVLNTVATKFGHKFELVNDLIGGVALDEHGTALTAATLDRAFGCHAILLGAVGGPKWDDPSAKRRPEQGLLALRKQIGLVANIRPVRLYPQLIDSSPLKPDIVAGVDFVFVRELVAGLYFGKPKARFHSSRGWRAVDTMSYTEHQIERVVRLAFDMAKRRKRKLVHSVDKMNVLETSRLWREVAERVGGDYPEVELRHMLVDNAAMQLVRKPSQFDVIVTENTFGDILSDEASVLAGSMGMLPSASLPEPPRNGSQRGRQKKPSLYEPVHGSAPDIAGKNLANPLGAILSMAMMLNLSFGLAEEARAVENAVENALNDGYLTADIAGAKKPVTTSEMGSAVAARIGV